MNQDKKELREEETNERIENKQKGKRSLFACSHQNSKLFKKSNIAALCHASK